MKRLSKLTKFALFEDLLVLLIVENFILQLLIFSVGGRVGGSSPAIYIEAGSHSIVALVQLDQLITSRWFIDTVLVDWGLF